MRFLYVLLYIFFTGNVFAQEACTHSNTHLHQLILAALEREALLKEAVSETRQQIRQQLPSGALRDSFDTVFSEMLGSNRQKRSFSEDINVFINKVIRVDSFTNMMNDAQKIIQQNYNFKYLGKIMPNGFELNDTAYNVQQLTFFNLKNNDKIGEIGAGSGFMAFLIGTLYDSIHIQINEISAGMVQRIEQDINYRFTAQQKKRFRVVHGATQTTGMEGEDLDVVIAIDAFHHFSDKENMLQAIRWSLTKNGRLILVEQDKDFSSPADYCREAMTQSELTRLLKENGFIKARECPLLGRSKQKVIMLEYIVNPL